MIDKELYDKLELACDVLTDCTRVLWNSGADNYARQMRTALTATQRVRDEIEKLLTHHDKED